MIKLAARIALPLLATAALAQAGPSPTGASKPQALPITQTIPPAKDVPYPGTIKLAVDATDTARHIFQISETIPVQPGHLVLLHPAWLPGAHAPQGEIDKIAGLTVTANGQTIPWTRDTVDVRAFHLDVPAGVTQIDVKFQFLSATDAKQGPVVMTPNIVALEWISNVLYPAGYYARQIMIDPSATFPAGWTSAGALRPAGAATAAGGTVHYGTVALDTLADSPTFAGRFYKAYELSPDVTLNVFGERPDQIDIKPELLAQHKALVAQATRLYGAQHYSHYDFLFAISDKIDGFGLEHHRSSEDQAPNDYYSDWDAHVAERDLLAHEYTHSWNGKFRRPADLWTPDYRTPMQNSLLWVYEGQTQFWGNILTARAGLRSKQEALDGLAIDAANYDTQPGRNWRALVDTTNEEIMSNRHPEPWPSWQRVEDYYREGQLVWLEADAILREKSGGRKSMDDFAHAFFGVKDRDWGELTYTVDDIAATLNAIQPYDWATFLKERVYAVAPKAPLGWIEKGGYKLVYTDKPGSFWKSRESHAHNLNLIYSGGLVIGKNGSVSSVQWDSPAFNAGIAVGATIVAINGAEYSNDDFKSAISNAKGGTQPIALLVKQGDVYRTVNLQWNGGLRYPHLEKTGKGSSGLDALLAARK
ncbi:putative metalloprotease with PDZ domain [Sphingomonas vulcanisoli]|uniref:Metalloprotease with PDZ domain n=1 Tax=Sphingomonas vulcanisoli TaxID=1658060 RepID=A0ABX0TU75_9SPHN|nr:M61 family metallopeptidase [Sphingomonas vulcanisoli]NIJ09006.1 putative metalloprotease with PDZ domain [Sphingomonas vulcanisoli]